MFLYKRIKSLFLLRSYELNINESYDFHCDYDRSSKLAIILHIYYPDLWDKIEEKLNSINQPFDIYISATEKNIVTEKINKYHKKTNILRFPNRGRDVLPFLMILKKIKELNQYEYVLKIHTKKSKHRKDGSTWFDEILNELLPKDSRQIFNILKRRDTGIIGPSQQVVSLSRYMGDNLSEVEMLLSDMFGSKAGRGVIQNPQYYPFFGGTMFWARLDFFEKLNKLSLKPSDFPAENGQVDGTIAHAIERVLGKAMHQLLAKKMYVVKSDGTVSELPEGVYTDTYKHV